MGYEIAASGDGMRGTVAQANTASGVAGRPLNSQYEPMSAQVSSLTVASLYGGLSSRCGLHGPRVEKPANHNKDHCETSRERPYSAQQPRT
jgi:hypothetical protein